MRANGRMTMAVIAVVLAVGFAWAGAAVLVPGDDPELPRVRYEDGQISINDRCPLRHGKLSAGIDPVYVNGAAVGFCCKPCPKKFALDPQLYLEQLDITLPCVVDAREDAVLDVEHRVFVNHETFFLSSDAALEAFRDDPLRYVGLLTDPVSGERFQPVPDSPTRVLGDRTFYFVSQDTRDAFERDPQRFALPDRERAG